MTRIIALILVVFLWSLLFAQNAKPEKQRIAVLELSADGITKAESQTLTNRLRSELVKTGAFIVLERGEMDDILKEQGFQLSGCTSNECAVEAGKLLNVREMVAGSVGKVGTLYSIDVRLIDVETGEIVKTVTEDCQCPIERVLTQSIRKVAYKLAGRIVTTTVETTLEEGRGDLFIKTNPSGAKIFLDNMDTGKHTPETLQDIQAGDHFIKVVKGKYIGTKSVKVKANDLVSVSINLRTATGSIKVYSDPPEASIFIDGKWYGTTPKIIKDLSVGEHMIRLTHDDYEDYVQKVQVKYNQFTGVDVKLKLLGKLSVKTVPDRVAIYLNGQFKGYSPKVIPKLPSGTYALRLVKNGYMDFDASVKIEPEKTTTINARLKQFAILAINSDPMNAQVIINGENRGKTPITILLEPQGNIRVELVKPLYEKWEKTISLKEGEQNKIFANLVKQKGTLVFTNLQPGSKITVTGDYGKIFTVTKRKIDLPVGKYKIRITNPGYVAKSYSVFIKSAKTRIIDAVLEAKTRSGAIKRSLFIPGLGQAYQGKNKRAFFFGISFVASIGGSYLFTKQYNKNIDEYNNLHLQYENAVQSKEIINLRKQMNDKYDEINQAEKMRNLFYMAVGGVWLLNVLDAAILPPAWHNKTTLSAKIVNNTLMAGLTVKLSRVMSNE